MRTIPNRPRTRAVTRNHRRKYQGGSYVAGWRWLMFWSLPASSSKPVWPSVKRDGPAWSARKKDAKDSVCGQICRRLGQMTRSGLN